MEHIVLPNVAQNEYMIARNLHSSYIGVNVLEACNVAIVLYSKYSVLLYISKQAILVSYNFHAYGKAFCRFELGNKYEI